MTGTKSAVAALVALFLVTAASYSLVVPPFETPDEIFHYSFARHLAAGNPLPVQSPVATGPWEHEGSQPPLFYALAGLTTSTVDQSDFDSLSVRNPRANLGNPSYPGNKNFALYSAQSRPLQGANLAVHLGRWLNVLLGAATVLCTFILARQAFPRDSFTQIMATGLVALNPQFLFISASFSNDPLISALSSLALVAVARWQAPVPTWRAAGLGLVLGLAALSKLQGLGLPLLVGATCAVQFFPSGKLACRPDWRALKAGLRYVSLAFIVAAGVAGWWYARNLYLYGDLFGTSNLLNISGLRGMDVTWGEFVGLHMSFWGLYGWFSILLPEWTYRVFAGLSVIGAIGAVTIIVVIKNKRPGTHAATAAVLWATLMVVMMVAWVFRAHAAQGRLLFPAVSALALLMAAGLRFLLSVAPSFLRWLVGATLLAFLLACSLYALTDLLPAAYSLDRQAVDRIPAEARPVGKVYGDDVELVAVLAPSGRFSVGDEVPVTLYLRALQAQDRDHHLVLKLLDDRRRQLGNITTHPGWGTWPLSLWKPGEVYADTYRILVEEPAVQDSPLLADLYLGFLEEGSEKRLPVQGGDPSVESNLIGEVEIDATVQCPQEMRGAPVRFGGAVVLNGFQFAEELSGPLRELPVILCFRASAPVDKDLKAFVHLVGPNGEFIAGYDQPPAEGRFPTSRWRAGDASLGTWPVKPPAPLSDGVNLQVWAGLYGPDGVRLPAASDSLETSHDRVLLGTVTVK
ncbi:MAG: hypothetical protein OXK78_11125 [Caldilineaceae bacterium]|nr:hypothetical protein [Caldilineaceae bacterium]